MKYFNYLTASIFMAFALSANAGRYDHAPVIVDLVNYVGEGGMAAARYSNNDIEEVGCRIRSTAGVGSQVQCQARDANDVLIYCTSEDPQILEAARSISSYSWISFTTDQRQYGECLTLNISNKSFHIPDTDNVKGK